jgi:hypothetical protein
MRALLVRSSIALTLTTLAAGCGGGSETRVDAGRGSDAGTDAGHVEPDAGGDAGISCAGETPLTEIDARARAELGVRGEGWLVMTGWSCAPLGVSGASGALRQGLGTQCICECPAPQPPFASSLVRLSPDVAVPFVWEGRELATWSECVDCADRGWPGGGVQEELHGALRPVAAGSYTLTLLVFDTLPASCTDLGEGIASCTPPTGPPGPTSGELSLCPEARAITTTITLPESGIVRADVTVPAR